MDLQTQDASKKRFRISVEARDFALVIICISRYIQLSTYQSLP